jgi:hypothetical protein
VNFRYENIVLCHFWIPQNIYGNHKTFMATTEQTEQTEQTERTERTEQTEQTEHPKS